MCGGSRCVFEWLFGCVFAWVSVVGFGRFRRLLDAVWKCAVAFVCGVSRHWDECGVEHCGFTSALCVTFGCRFAFGLFRRSFWRLLRRM